MKQGSKQNNYLNLCWQEIEPTKKQRKKVNKLKNKLNQKKYKFIATHPIAQGSKVEFILTVSIIVITIVTLLFTFLHW